MAHAVPKSADVVVWEWKDQTNRWQQYDRLVSDFLERKHKEDTLQTVQLSEIDPVRLSNVSVGFSQMAQYHAVTGI